MGSEMCIRDRYQPDLIVVMNPIYEDEIRDRLKVVGVSAEIRSVGK